MHSRWFGLVLAALFVAPPVSAQTGTTASSGSGQAAPGQSPTFATAVTVIEAAPLPGVDLPIEKIPAPVQTAASDEIERSKALDFSSFMTRRFNAVFANEIQNNPFQADINYRGYTASPTPRRSCTTACRGRSSASSSPHASSASASGTPGSSRTSRTPTRAVA